jgi:hypothetical protein
MSSESLPEARGDAPALVVFGVLAILVCLGLALEAPGVLVVLLSLATPALIRTIVALSRRQTPAAPPSGLAALGTFLSSLGVMAMVGLASAAAFYATCFVVCLGGLALSDKPWGGDWILVASVGAGLVPGLAVAVLLFRLLWKRKG